MIALVCVDGTGPQVRIDPVEYDKIYSTSNTSDIFKSWPNDYKAYFRGPGILGFETRRIAADAYAKAKALRTSPGVDALFMVGHSRGCAALVEAARMLENDNITVEFMAFFDAVDMSTSVNATVVPANVKEVIHARRDPSGRSRSSWGNCGTRMANGMTFSYKEEFFYGTHGGIGGVPHTTADETPDGYIYEVGEPWQTYITAAQDQQAEQDAWNFIYPVLKSRMDWIPVGLGTPSSKPNTGIGIGVGAGNGLGNGSGYGTRPPAGNGPTIGTQYTVVPGDSLSLISNKFWKDVLLWPIVYDKNKSVIGANPNLIKPGQKLTIPSIAGLSQSQLNDTRARGRNWR